MKQSQESCDLSLAKEHLGMETEQMRNVLFGHTTKLSSKEYEKATGVFSPL